MAFNSSALLGLASAALGSAQRPHNDPLLPFIMQDIQSRRQAGVAQDEMAAQANRLQQAQDFAIQKARAESTPTSPTYFRGSDTPLGQSVRMSKMLTRKAIFGDQPLAPADQATLDQAEKNNLVDQTGYEKLAKAISGRLQTQQKETGKTEAETQKAATAAQKTAQVEADKAATAHRQELKPRLAELQKEIEAAGYDVSGPPAQFNPVQTVTPRSTVGNLSDLVVGGVTESLGGIDAPTVTLKGGDPEMRRQYTEYQRLLQEMQGARPGQFVKTATAPRTGHKIGQLPDGTWVDAITGQPIAG